MRPVPRRLVAAGVAVATAAAALTITGTVVGATLSPASATSSHTVTFTSATSQTWTVPAGVSSLTVTASGAHGGSYDDGTGYGRTIRATLPVGPNEAIHSGDQLVVTVGGTGGYFDGGFNGGGKPGSGFGLGGGGASDLRLPAGTLAARILVAGGGGGQGYFFVPGSGLGGNADAAGSDGTDVSDDNSGGQGRGGQPGTNTAGGTGGAGGENGSAGAPGIIGSGGDGGSLANYAGGGGGGGGYYGGGGGGSSSDCGCTGGGGGGGGSSYVEASATKVIRSLAAGPAMVEITYTGPDTQAVAFTSTAPTNAHVDDVYTAAATGGDSGNPVTFSVDPGSTTGYGTDAAACSVSGSTVSLLHTGTCRIDADQAGDGDYYAAPQQHQDIVVHQAPGSISFAGDTPSTGYRSGSAFVTATGDGSTRTITITSTTTGVCTVGYDDGNGSARVDLDQVGTCTVKATQAGDGDHAEASTTHDITISKQPGNVSFATAAPGDAAVGDTYYALVNGDGSDRYTSITSTTPDICTTIDGIYHDGEADSIVSFDHVGTCTLEGTQSGDADHDAGSATQDITVGQGNGSVAFTSDEPFGSVVGDTYRATAVGDGSSRALTFTTTTPDVCSIVPGSSSDGAASVRADHVGTCTVQATQAGDADHQEASNSQSYDVAPAPGQVAFTSTAPTDAVVGDFYTATATGDGSNRAVTVSSTTPGICYPLGGASGNGSLTVVANHVGTCTIEAEQAGDADHQDGSATQSFQIAPAPGLVYFTSAPPTDGAIGDVYDVSAAGLSTAPVQIATTTPGVCTVTPTKPARAQVSLDHAGTCHLTADQAGDADHTQAPTATQDVTVSPAASRLTLLLSTDHPVVGQALIPTAVVASDAGQAAGRVQFEVDGTPVGTPVALDDQGRAVGPDLADVVTGHVGRHTVRATFLPADAGLEASAAGTHGVAVSPAATTTALTVGDGSLTAQVDPVAPGAGVPTGKVTFRDGDRVLGTAPLSAEGDGAVATLTASVPAGHHDLTATYAGDNDFTGSTSAPAPVENPTITAQVVSSLPRTPSGWYRVPVTVRFTCRPGSAPLTGSCPSPVHLGKDTRGVTVVRSVRATDGGSATARTRVRVDRTAPTVRIAHVHDRHPRCVAHDATSGVRVCHLHRSNQRARNGDLIVRLRAVAIDHAGNLNIVRRHYRQIRR